MSENAARRLVISHHRFARAAALVAGLAWLGAACDAGGPDPAAVRAAIDDANESLVAAVLAGNSGDAAARYTEDAALFPPGAPPVRGREAIGEFWAGADVAAFVIRTGEVEASGDLAAETGTWAITLRTPEGAEESSAGSYVVVWRREAGRWRLHRDIWNEDGGRAAVPADR